MTTVARMAALRHQKQLQFTRVATPKGQDPIPVTVDAFEAYMGRGAIPLEGGGVGEPRTGNICRCIHCTDCCGCRWRLQPNQRDTKKMQSCLSAAEARTQGGLGPPRLHPVCQAGAADLRKPLQTTKTKETKYAEERRNSGCSCQCSLASQVKSCCIFADKLTLRGKDDGTEPSESSSSLTSRA